MHVICSGVRCSAVLLLLGALGVVACGPDSPVVRASRTLSIQLLLGPVDSGPAEGPSIALDLGAMDWASSQSVLNAFFKKEFSKYDAHNATIRQGVAFPLVSVGVGARVTWQEVSWAIRRSYGPAEGGLRLCVQSESNECLQIATRDTFYPRLLEEVNTLTINPRASPAGGFEVRVHGLPASNFPLVDELVLLMSLSSASSRDSVLELLQRATRVNRASVIVLDLAGVADATCGELLPVLRAVRDAKIPRVVVASEGR
jgi:hypothetical protein